MYFIFWFDPSGEYSRYPTALEASMLTITPPKRRSRKIVTKVIYFCVYIVLVYKVKDLCYHQNVYTYSAEDNNVTARFTTDICSHERAYS